MGSSPPPRPILGGAGMGVLLLHCLQQVLDHCPSPSLAPAVEAPLLVPETVELLEKTLHQNNYSTWKSLGMAWNKSRWGPAPPTPKRGVQPCRGGSHHPPWLSPCPL